MRVLIVQRRLPHYRVAFFEALRQKLRESGVELLVACGDATAGELQKHDGGALNWAISLPGRYLMGDQIYWQPFGRLLRDVHMVVMGAENKLIYNLVVQYFSPDLRIGLWGHGANLQGNPRSLRERFKRRVARQCDWWFAYTAMSVPLIRQTGFPAECITVLNNAIDTDELARQRKQVIPECLVSTRAALELDGSCVGVFLGSLYVEKRIDFLLAAALEIKASLPAFELLIIGSGPQSDLVAKFANTHGWVRALGPLTGQTKVNVLGLAKVMLNPGLVGLGILDSFICGLPMVTTDCGLHSPEIAYLDHGSNGLMTPDRLPDYTAAVVQLLTDEALLMHLREGCEQSGQRYTVENMAQNFADGVLHCLAAPIRRGQPRAVRITAETAQDDA